ncbi:hypothetical protein LINPERHAP1_LOCUS17725 [Linum perenne]
MMLLLSSGGDDDWVWGEECNGWLICKDSNELIFLVTSTSAMSLSRRIKGWLKAVQQAHDLDSLISVPSAQPFTVDNLWDPGPADGVVSIVLLIGFACFFSELWKMLFN